MKYYIRVASGKNNVVFQEVRGHTFKNKYGIDLFWFKSHDGRYTITSTKTGMYISQGNKLKEAKTFALIYLESHLEYVVRQINNMPLTPTFGGKKNYKGIIELYRLDFERLFGKDIERYCVSDTGHVYTGFNRFLFAEEVARPTITQSLIEAVNINFGSEAADLIMTIDKKR